MALQTVIETPSFLADAKAAGLDEFEREAIVTAIAADPLAGDLIPGTGGARKRRFAANARGKSGGYRVLFYFASEEIPVFLLALVDKGQRVDISQAERNELRRHLATIADKYRTGAQARRRR
jgi:hypothetical protein